MKIGILGCAHGHFGVYCARWQREPDLGIEVVAGWDHDGERLARAAKQHGFAAAASPEALLGMPGLEGVLIASETSFHADLVEKAAAAGKTIVLQKPISLALEEADHIVAAVGRAGVRFSMAWQMRVDPENLKMRELVHDGALGRLFAVRRRHRLGFCLEEANWNSWHLDPAYNRDIWADDAAHPIDFVYWMLGMPASVTAELSTCFRPSIPNDNGVAVFRYPDGTLAEVSCSFVCRAGENTTEIVGEKGVIVQNHGDAPSAPMPRAPGFAALRWHLAGEPGWRSEDLPVFANQGERIANLAGPLADFFHGRREPVGTASEARDVLRLVLACYESNEKGRRVPIQPGSISASPKHKPHP